MVRKNPLTLANSRIRTSIRCLQSLTDGPGDPAPKFCFLFELFSSGFGQTIIFCTAVVFGISPKRGNPSFFFHAVQRGKKGTRLDQESTAGNELNSAGYSEPMHFGGDQRP